MLEAQATDMTRRVGTLAMRQTAPSVYDYLLFTII
jgi:hypothetical protein